MGIAVPVAIYIACVRSETSLAEIVLSCSSPEAMSLGRGGLNQIMLSFARRRGKGSPHLEPVLSERQERHDFE